MCEIRIKCIFIHIFFIYLTFIVFYMLFSLRCCSFFLLVISVSPAKIPICTSQSCLNVTSFKNPCWIFPSILSFLWHHYSFNTPQQTLRSLKGKHRTFLKHRQRALIIFVSKPKTKGGKQTVLLMIICASHNNGYLTTAICSPKAMGYKKYSYYIISFTSYSSIVLWVKEQT